MLSSLMEVAPLITSRKSPPYCHSVQVNRILLCPKSDILQKLSLPYLHLAAGSRDLSQPPTGLCCLLHHLEVVTPNIHCSVYYKTFLYLLFFFFSVENTGLYLILLQN